MSKFRSFARYAAFAAILGGAGYATYDLTRPPYDGTAGITYGEAYAPIRDQNVDFTLWYPAQPGGKAVTVGGNGVFYGTPAGRGAPHQAGQFPTVIISHGAGGNAGQFGWIASELAQAGFVVVLPNHPGTTTGNASAEAAIRVWERPADVSAVLDELTGNPGTYAYIDPARISMLGFSAGGYTAMALSGARVDPDRLQRFCDETDHGMSDCAFLAHFGIDLHAYDLSPAAQDLRDPRIRNAVVVDPGIVSTLTASSLAEIEIPMQIINLGDAGTIPAGVDAAQAAALIPHAQHLHVPDSTHFSFLAPCKPAGARILENEGELDPLCDDAGGQSRASIHAKLVDLIVGYLRKGV
ncbi:MAG: alpha/beta hydrolase family protein [Paracoccaceae bacterium]